MASPMEGPFCSASCLFLATCSCALLMFWKTFCNHKIINSLKINVLKINLKNFRKFSRNFVNQKIHITFAGILP